MSVMCLDDSRCNFRSAFDNLHKISIIILKKYIYLRTKVQTKIAFIKRFGFGVFSKWERNFDSKWWQKLPKNGDNAPNLANKPSFIHPLPLLLDSHPIYNNVAGKVFLTEVRPPNSVPQSKSLVAI